MMFFPTSCTFFLNVCRVVNVRHILFVYIFFGTILAFVEMSVCHLRMFVKHIYWQFTLTLETNLCNHLIINYFQKGKSGSSAGICATGGCATGGVWG